MNSIGFHAPGTTQRFFFRFALAASGALSESEASLEDAEDSASVGVGGSARGKKVLGMCVYPPLVFFCV